MIYNDRLDSPVGHFLSKYCPKTALMLSKPHFTKNERTAKVSIEPT